MPDVNSQVALGINAPDPNQGMNTLSKILQIGSQGLGIKEQQAKVKQAQIETERQVGLKNFFQSWDPSEHDGPDGTTNMESARKSDAYKAAGLAKPDIDLKLSQIKQAQLQNKQSLTTLNGDNLAQFGRVAQALADDPDVKADQVDPQTKTGPGRQKFNEALGGFAQLGPDAARVAGIFAPIAQHAPPGKLITGVRSLAAQAQDISQQQGQQNPQLTTNAAGQLVNRDVRTGELSAPTLSGGATNPSTPQVAGQAARNVGPANSDIDRSNVVSAAVAPANQTITITQEIDDLADQVHSGKISAAISKAAAAVGISGPTYARQLLEKDLGRLKATASAGAGSDQRQANILAGFPDATSDPQTIHTAMDFTRGVARQDLARGALLNKVKSKDPELRGFQHLDDMLTGQTDPLMHEFMSLKPSERSGFYSRNFTSAEKAQEFKNKVLALQNHSGLVSQ